MLNLHLPTLMVTTVLVNLTLGAFCLTCWFGRADRKIYFWLSLASSASMLGCILLMLRSVAPEWLTVWLGQGLLLACSGLLWAGIREFELRPLQPIGIWAGAAVWTLFYLIPTFQDNVAARVLITTLLIALQFSCMGWELLRRYRDEPTRSRIIALVVVFTHIIATLCRISLIFQGADGNWPNLPASTSVGVFIIETIVTTIGLVLALSMMERDRAELLQRKAASTDVLTGALNRRAFIDTAVEWVEKRGQDAALILFDLDHFKRINDTFGHSSGDAALIAFSELVTQRTEVANLIARFNRDEAGSNQFPRWYEATVTGADDDLGPIFGRLGGEEFACLLPHITLHQASAIAEDIRNDVQQFEIPARATKFKLSVSAGVVSTTIIGHRLDLMLSSADHALYRAKDMGRNRIEAGTAEPNHFIQRHVL